LLFVEREQAHHPVVMLCRVLGVSSSGYYARRKRRQSMRAQEDVLLTARIIAIHDRSRATSGAPRVHAELRALGLTCGRKRVARLMRVAALVGCHRRRSVSTTRREPTAPVAPDRVERRFVATAPNTVWSADITYVPTWEGFLYLAVVLDGCSRRIVGWAMADHLRTDLVVQALEMALWDRRPQPGVIHHSDHGCQDTSVAFGQRCLDAGILPSMGSVGDCYDHAVTESFFATLECELLDRHIFRTQAQARTALFAFIEGFYNTQRRHSALGYRSPAEFERHVPDEAAV
jgi:putative transposase